MAWTTEKHEVEVPEPPDLAWAALIDALGLPNRFCLPGYLRSECTFPDEIHQGLRLEVVGSGARTRIPTQLTLWLPQEKCLTLSLLNADDLIPWRHYEFSVQPDSDGGSKIHLSLSSAPLERWRRVLDHVFREKESNYAQVVLSAIINDFPGRAGRQ